VPDDICTLAGLFLIAALHLRCIWLPVWDSKSLLLLPSILLAAAGCGLVTIADGGTVASLEAHGAVLD
jgi:hypothetical protein